MFNQWLFYIAVHLVIIMLLMACIDQNHSIFTRQARLAMVHRTFTFRNKFFPFLTPRPEGMDADAKALEELILLYRVTTDLAGNTSNYDVAKLRYHSKRMLSGLHPARSSSCLVHNHIFLYNTNRVEMYSIHHDPNDQWKDTNRSFVLYFHGGGFVSGGIETYEGFECHLSKDLNMLILHVNFRLAPEFSLKDIIEDVINVYEILLHVDRNIHQRMIGMGDSSGGLLWIYLLQWIITNNKSVPQAVVLHSPWPSLNFPDMDSDVPVDNYFPPALAYDLRQQLIGEDVYWFQLTDEEKENLNPKENFFEKFPPVYITAGTREFFIDEIRQMTSQMRLAGVEVILDEGESLMHTYALFHLWSTKAKCVQGKIRQWIERHLMTNVKSTWNRKMQSNLIC